MDNDFSHLNEKGQPTMVDVGHKNTTVRKAIAQATVWLPDHVWQLLEEGEINTKKGAVFQTAIVAGIMAAKKTSDLIPLCHPLGLDKCTISISATDKNEVVIQAEAMIHAKTGVEMEALVGASIAALTIYDMCKAYSHDITIKETRLLKKTGGKSDFNKQ